MAIIIEYNSNTIASVKGGQTAKLATKGKILEGDIVVDATKVVESSGNITITENGVYDVSNFATVTVNVTAGVSVISFTIDGTEYEAEAGMSWYRWCKSAYNTGGYTCAAETQAAYVYTSNNEGAVALVSGSKVTGEDTIFGEDEYEVRVEETPETPTISFTIDGTTYTAEDGWTWGEWCGSDYDSLGLEADALVYYLNNREHWITDADGNNVYDEDPITADGEYYCLTEQTSETISFTIDGTPYTAEAGMTWGEWCDDKRYNTNGYGYDTAVYDESGNPVKYSDGSSVYDGHKIEANGKYRVDKPIRFTIDSTEYEADNAYTDWLTWCRGQTYFEVEDGKVKYIKSGSPSVDFYVIDSSGNKLTESLFIVSGAEYKTIFSFEIDNDEYFAVTGMSWGQWIDNVFYNTDGYQAIDDTTGIKFVCNSDGTGIVADNSDDFQTVDYYITPGASFKIIDGTVYSLRRS